MKRTPRKLSKCVMMALTGTALDSLVYKGYYILKLFILNTFQYHTFSILVLRINIAFELLENIRRKKKSVEWLPHTVTQFGFVMFKQIKMNFNYVTKYQEIERNCYNPSCINILYIDGIVAWDSFDYTFFPDITEYLLRLNSIIKVIRSNKLH